MQRNSVNIFYRLKRGKKAQNKFYNLSSGAIEGLIFEERRSSNKINLKRQRPPPPPPPCPFCQTATNAIATAPVDQLELNAITRRSK